MHFEKKQQLETTSSQNISCQTHKFVCLTASFLATGGFVKLLKKVHDFTMIIQGFSNSMIFPCMELFS